eukprot:2299138-Ditylum_brightwellii.AAC.1
MAEGKLHGDVDVMETTEDISSAKEESEDDEESDEDGGIAKQFELPDGTKVDLVKRRAGKDLCRLP